MGLFLDPSELRGGLREEIGHYLPLSQFQPLISVEGHLDITDDGFFTAQVVLEYDNTDVPLDTRLQSATAPLRDRRTPRRMSDLDSLEAKRVQK